MNLCMGQRSLQVSSLRNGRLILRLDLLDWNPLVRLGWPANKPQRSACLPVSRTGMTNTPHQACRLYGC